MDEFILEKETGAGSGNHGAEFYLGTVTAGRWGDTVQIQLDGQSAAMSKWYKTVNGPLAAGARVVVMKQSGTYIVLGAVQASEAATPWTSTLTAIATAATGFTLIDAEYAQFGKVATLFMRFRPTTPITTTQEFQIATMVAGKRPKAPAPVNYWASQGGYVDTDGSVWCYGTCTNTSGSYAIYTTYVVA